MRWKKLTAIWKDPKIGNWVLDETLGSQNIPNKEDDAKKSERE